MPKVAFTSLGDIGEPRAVNLIKARHVVTNFDLVSPMVARRLPCRR
jgi:3-hydroxyisobutyrate dehydrogenase-like beta-hydroxyacid dehydrogenase